MPHLYYSGAEVSCGNHNADSCANCPKCGDNWCGSGWCNGDCTWKDSKCILDLSCSSQYPIPWDGPSNDADGCCNCDENCDASCLNEVWENPRARRAPSIHATWPSPGGLKSDGTETLWYNSVQVLDDAANTFYMISGWGQGYSGIQRRTRGTTCQDPWIIFSVWDFGCKEGANPQPDSCVPAEVVDIGPETIKTGFGGEGTGRKTYIRKALSNDDRHAILIKTSRKIGQADRRDCTVAAWYRTERLDGSAVDDWLYIGSFRFGCNSHPLQGSYSFVEDWTGNGHQRAAAFGPSMYSFDNGDSWEWSVRTAFTHDIWYEPCNKDTGDYEDCDQRRDGYWIKTADNIDRFKLVTGSVKLHCETHDYGHRPEVDHSVWEEADLVGSLPWAERECGQKGKLKKAKGKKKIKLVQSACDCHDACASKSDNKAFLFREKDEKKKSCFCYSDFQKMTTKGKTSVVGEIEER